jgi:hypothetical protein
MKSLTNFLSEPKWRWWLGLILTLLVIFLLSWNIRLTNQLSLKIDNKSTAEIGYPTKRLDEMWMKINSLERLIHTVPLVECGNNKN